ncbi:hypothetical protein [Sphingomonas sp. LHG3406-1]|uniref:tetratricopeptide repeat protein n=1 Tax=Sphingomonas sp. LHG3406-1 TaxID=2804617 RepID=UPI00263A2CF4|nr:hypothetical protein [Sphingomonas sp. LHG3406-1]
MLIAAAILLQSVSLGPPSPPTGQDFRSGGQGSWVEMGQIGRCGLPHADCAREAFEEGRTPDAITHLQAAAKKGDAWAMRTIGLILMRGEGVAQDPETGASWLFEAALHGDKPAMRALGTAFRQGLGVDRDSRLADYWTAKSR